MSAFEVGDLVVLKSGSMRMCVEGVEGDKVSTVWCNEGVIGRDTFAVILLNKWEHREDHGGRGGDRGGRDDRGGGHKGGGRPYGGDRDGGGKPYGGRGGDRGDRGGRDDRGGDRGGRDDRPPKKTGWDGKPRDKKFYRKDD